MIPLHRLQQQREALRQNPPLFDPKCSKPVEQQVYAWIDWSARYRWLSAMIRDAEGANAASPADASADDHGITDDGQPS